jgi:sulfide:quinone oxidoreductase
MLRAMTKSYPVAWWEAGEPTYVGKLDVHPGHLQLEGRTRDGAASGELWLSYDELVSARVGRTPLERLEGRPALVLGRTAGGAVHLVTLEGLGTLHELVETLGHEIAERRPPHDPLEVVIAGGGVAGLEALLALHAHAAGLVRVTLLSATPVFTYRPLAVAVPFGRGEEHRFELEPIAANCDAKLRVGALARVDAAERRVVTDDGDDLPYDVLVVALGARAETALPGAITFWANGEAASLRAALDDVAAGRSRRLVFALPGGLSWPLPLYELALLSASWLHERGVDDAEIVLVTAEPSPLGVCETEATEAVARLLSERGIRLVSGVHPVAFERGALSVVGGDSIPADHVVSLPRLTGPRLAGLPHDERGFIPVDAYGHVSGLADVFAAGDATAFPIKQGGIAAQQADVAAEAVAARAGARIHPSAFRPILRGLLLTGDEPLFLRTELGGGRGPTSTATSDHLWWPAGKIAGQHLSSYLAAHADATAAA